jgi:hypothetical protein
VHILGARTVVELFGQLDSGVFALPVLQDPDNYARYPEPYQSVEEISQLVALARLPQGKVMVGDTLTAMTCPQRCSVDPDRNSIHFKPASQHNNAGTGEQWP